MSRLKGSVLWGGRSRGCISHLQVHSSARGASQFFSQIYGARVYLTGVFDWDVPERARSSVPGARGG